MKETRIGNFRYTVDMPIPLYKKLKLFAAAHGLTLREVVIEGIKQQMDLNSQDKKEALKKLKEKKEFMNLLKEIFFAEHSYIDVSK